MSTSKKLAVPLALASIGLLFVALLPASQGTHAAYGNTGTQVAFADTDYAPRFASAANAFVLRTQDAAPGAATYWLHFGLSSDTATTAGDVVLTGASKGTVVTAVTSGLYASTAAFAANLYTLEVDGKPGYTSGDMVYWSADGTLNTGSTSNGQTFSDIRIVTATVNATTMTAGTAVNASEVDITAAGTSDQVLPDTTTLTAFGGALQFTDRNGNGVMDLSSSGDVLKISNANTTSRTFLALGDVFVATSGGYTFGTRVLSSTTKEIPLVTGINDKATLVYTAPSANATISDYKFYIHFGDVDNTNNTINIGDIQLAGSSMTFGTRVTTVATGYGETIPCTNSPPLIQTLLFYLDRDAINGYTDGDALYINTPARCGFRGTSDTLLVDANDIRASSVPGTSFVAGTLTAGSDSDTNVVPAPTVNPVTGRWNYVLYNEDLANFVALTALTNGKFYDINANQNYDAGDSVYVDTDGSNTVTATDIRIFNGPAVSSLNPGATGVDSTTSNVRAVQAGDGDLGLVLKTPKSFKKSFWVTGPDGTFDAGKSEYVYASVDAIVNTGDVRLTNISAAAPTMLANETLAAGARDTFKFGPGNQAERTFFTWCRQGQANETGASCSATTIPLLLHVHDIEVVSGATRISATSAEHVPWLMMMRPSTTTQTFLRFNRGDTGSVVDDTFYLGIKPAGATTLQAQHVRVTALDASNPSGRTASSSIETSSSASEVTNGSVVFRQNIRYIDVDANGYDSGDFLVYDNPAATGGTNVGTYGFGDERLTPTGAASGATTSPAGTIRVNNEADQSFTTFADTAGTRHFQLFQFDVNRNNDTDFETRGHDRLYIMYSTSGAATDGGSANGNASETNPLTPLINSVRLVGPGGSAAPTGSTVAPGGSTTTVIVPTLASGSVSPSQCVAANAAITFSVTYTDSLNRGPTTNNLIFNSITSAMSNTAFTYSSGVAFTKATTAPATAGSYASSFSFANAGGSATLTGPTVVVMPTDNVAPILATGTVTPTSGAGGDEFTYAVTYTDLNNNAPTVMKVKIDGVDHDMTTSDTVYCDGSIFTYKQVLGSGAHTFVFEFSDGTTTVKLPTTDTSAGPTVTGGTLTATTTTTTSKSATTTATKKKPTPGFEGVALLGAIVLAAAAIAVYRRK